MSFRPSFCAAESQAPIGGHVGQVSRRQLRSERPSPDDDAGRCYFLGAVQICWRGGLEHVLFFPYIGNVIIPTNQYPPAICWVGLGWWGFHSVSAAPHKFVQK